MISVQQESTLEKEANRGFMAFLEDFVETLLFR